MPEPIVLGNAPSILNHWLAELRDATLQPQRARFRRNLERCGTLLAYEVSRHLPYDTEWVETPLGEAEVKRLEHPPVVAPILRAALPLHQGFLEVYPEADSAFVAAYRLHHQGKEAFTIQVDYLAAPQLTGRTLILLDTMIATGRSVVAAYEALVNQGGTPQNVHVVGLLASQEGVAYLERHLPQAQLWVVAVDAELTARGYIVPGLGDAGDLAYGEKMS